ncbi:MAG: tRNA pseudouridine(38-40) synthase TruA [Cyclobacteriaceae bacterium]|nr:tRNA pseudouridine(38-40) synthase TruA [Cyclobacteriaceae bacterium]MDH4294839.1 tRNA pseudouridine(38-40) synthase TruA [Cyclobacteriaceae bacterium]MDH5248108.1 tRNA pseudouridine(38-40) synthase TruA [Cyclobacteriaceae bacterium]
MRFFFHIGYNGGNYRGWQRQLGPLSVQQVLETTISQVLKNPVSIMGCGRTDAMVHASQFFFHVDVDKEWDFDLLFRLNKNLPADIAIFEIILMKDNQHARFDATQRTYDYFMHTYKDPFLHSMSALYLEKDLDLEKMKAATALLPAYTDFRAFCKSPDEYEHTICNVTSAKLFTDTAGDRLRFQISANRFLGRMIRILVGKLLEIGRGEMSVAEFEHYLVSKETPKTIEPAYPQGLYLSKVTYPYLDIPPRTMFSATLENSPDVWQAL